MLDETVAIQTPEGVEIRVTPASIGSRFLALAGDSIYFTLIYIVLALIVVTITESMDLGAFFAIAMLMGTVLAYCGYFVAFEMLMNGRTPGKRSAGIRVIKTTGEDIDFTSSCLRNIVRIVDFLPFFYGVGIVTMFISTQSRRLGDYSANTLVIHDAASKKISRRQQRKNRKREAKIVPSRFTADDVIGWDVSGVSNDELSVLRSFLGRRNDLLPHARLSLSGKLASTLRWKVSGPNVNALNDEDFLECVNLAKSVEL